MGNDTLNILCMSAFAVWFFAVVYATRKRDPEQVKAEIDRKWREKREAMLRGERHD